MTDHCAEAEALIRACDALRDNYAADIPWAEIQAAATLAQVHLTLAATRTARSCDDCRAETDELRAAARDYLAVAPPAPAPGRRELNRLRELVEAATR